MNEITKYVPGTFCWEDLYTTDVPEAKHSIKTCSVGTPRRSIKNE